MFCIFFCNSLYWQLFRDMCHVFFVCLLSGFIYFNWKQWLIAMFKYCTFVYYAPYPGQRPGTAKGGERAWLGWVHLYFLGPRIICLRWLLCVLWCYLQANDVRSYHVLLPQVVCQNQKPKIDGVLQSLLHI